MCPECKGTGLATFTPINGQTVQYPCHCTAAALAAHLETVHAVDPTEAAVLAKWLVKLGQLQTADLAALPVPWQPKLL